MFNNYTKIGKTASADKFVRELKKFKSYIWQTEKKNGELIDGAAQAFREGNPKNIQTALSYIKDIESGYHPDIAALILFKASEKSDDKLAAINLALMGVLSDDKKKLLSKALNNAIESNIGGEAFYALLIKSGADANAAINGYASVALVTATVVKSPFAVIKLLHDNGASFDEALTTMHSQGRGIDEIRRLEHYQLKLEGNKPAPAAADGDEDIRQSLRDIKRQLQTLTEAFNALQASQAPAPSDKETPVPRRKPQQKPPYPTVG